MPADLNDTPPTKRRESIARVELFTDAHLSPDDWRLVIHFESAWYDADGKIVGRSDFGSRQVTRRFGDIKGDATVQQIVALIKRKAYEFRAEDLAREATNTGP